MSYDEYIKSLPKKRMAAAAIFFDEQGKILVVKPNYRDDWFVPGGSIEENESPQQGCMREVKEEIGLVIEKPQFLGINYLFAKMKNGVMGESVHFIFYGGVLAKEQIDSIVLQKEELIEYRFVTLEELARLCNERLTHRIQKGIEALKNNTAFYSEIYT